MIVPSAVSLALVLIGSSAVGGAPSLPAVRANDNRVPAGRLEGGRLRLDLELLEARWRASDAGREVRVFALAEAGKSPSIPGPLVRVPAGTMLEVTLRNRLDRPAVVHGFRDQQAPRDSVLLAPGETRTVRATMTTPGTRFYRARAVPGGREVGRNEDSQLVGALIVNSAETARPRDRVFVITTYDDRANEPAFPAGHFQIFAINGRSWPDTERLTATVGDRVRWRVINAGDHVHPMHLHGFHFTVESRGSDAADTVYSPAERRLAVTELMWRTGTMTLTWEASRSGNWLFHCHMINHMETALRAEPHHGSHDRVEDVMAGLVLAVSVRDSDNARLVRAVEAPRRTLRLSVTERPAGDGRAAAFGYLRQDGAVPPAADSIVRPGSTLVLRQGEPTEIVVTNRSRQPTAVHWHGLELESFFDGVPGWSGADARTAPIVAPGDSFRVRLTPPRAGTFMYHTHADERAQLTGGMFGVLLVLPPGAAEPAPTDRIVVLTEKGFELPGGDTVDGAPGLSLERGATHRLRLVSIPAIEPIRIRLVSDTTVATWRPVAKDGADLPATQAVPRPGEVLFGAGETLDVELRGTEGPLALELSYPGIPTRPPVRLPIRLR